jgi:hypothetical protein
LQKVNDKIVVGDFRDKLRLDQRKLFNKRLIKGVDYIEPVQKAPFDIDENYIMVLSKEEREFLDKQLDAERMRSLSPSTLWRLEDERLLFFVVDESYFNKKISTFWIVLLQQKTIQSRRIRDNILQEKIREFTVKMLNRRDEKSDNPKYDRVQAARDLRELKLIQKELEQRRYEIQFNLRAHTGALVYRETNKLNRNATVSHLLRKKINWPDWYRYHFRVCFSSSLLQNLFIVIVVLKRCSR